MGHLLITCSIRLARECSLNLSLLCRTKVMGFLSSHGCFIELHPCRPCFSSCRPSPYLPLRSMYPRIRVVTHHFGNQHHHQHEAAVCGDDICIGKWPAACCTRGSSGDSFVGPAIYIVHSVVLTYLLAAGDILRFIWIKELNYWRGSAAWMLNIKRVLSIRLGSALAQVLYRTYKL